MITAEQIDDFRAAVAFVWQGLPVSTPKEGLLEEAPMSRDEVVKTHEVYADFCKSRGPAQKTRTLFGREIHMWSNVQFYKNQTRGTLYLMEFDGVSLSYFF